MMGSDAILTVGSGEAMVSSFVAGSASRATGAVVVVMGDDCSALAGGASSAMACCCVLISGVSVCMALVSCFGSALATASFKVFSMGAS